MRKKLLFLTTMLLLFATSCHKEEFSVERARELASLHASPSEYTEDEIREIENQVDLNFKFTESMINDVLYASDSFERKRNLIKFATWGKNHSNDVEIIKDLVRILRCSQYTDSAKFEYLSNKNTEILMSLDMVKKEL